MYRIQFRPCLKNTYGLNKALKDLKNALGNYLHMQMQIRVLMFKLIVWMMQRFK